ncbi:protein obstructor-E-like, partial [Pollicipes pollicipes]|uniref:protein obstructor-E-like n=1 Tax=Pollicipes pollicipes TaxID=41117 RepID=UPI0018859F67
APGRRGSSSRVVPARTTPAPQAPTFDTECPQKDGFFADAFQCDRYYECQDFVITERMCPDGLVFNDYSVSFGRCDQPFGVNCTGREELQDPKPTGDCPRQNGYFADPKPTRCGSFVHCVDGTSNRVTCPAGLVFSLQTGTCQWPDQAGRTGCSSEEVLEFKCPGTVDGKLANPAPGFPLHPRYADPTDCQFFFSCLDGVVPRRHGCEAGRVFNDETKQCDKPENVPECYYE